MDSAGHAREHSRVEAIIDTGFELSVLFPARDEEGHHIASPPEDSAPVGIRGPDGSVLKAFPAWHWVRVSDGYEHTDLYVPVYYVDWSHEALLGQQLLSAYFLVGGQPEKDWTLEVAPGTEGVVLPRLDDRW